MQVGPRILISVSAAAVLFGIVGGAGAQSRPEGQSVSLTRRDAERIIRQAQESAARTASAPAN